MKPDFSKAQKCVRGPGPRLTPCLSEPESPLPSSLPFPRSLDTLVQSHENDGSAPGPLLPRQQLFDGAPRWPGDISFPSQSPRFTRLRKLPQATNPTRHPARQAPLPFRLVYGKKTLPRSNASSCTNPFNPFSMGSLSMPVQKSAHGTNFVYFILFFN